MLATLSPGNTPSASYAPLVWVDSHCYLFLSGLASHTRNLKHCADISLMITEAETGANKVFERRRISLQGSALVIARQTPEFERVLAQFHDRFGKVMTVIEPLPDFQLFRINLREGRFVKGFGQAYELSGEGLDDLIRIGPAWRDRSI